jgi:hypothetical protein
VVVTITIVKSNRKDLGDLNVEGNIILKWILNKYVTKKLAKFNWNPYGPENILFEYGNEHSCSMKGGKFLD